MRERGFMQGVIFLDFLAERSEEFVFRALALDVDAHADPAAGLQVLGELAYQPCLADSTRRRHLDATAGFEQPREFTALGDAVVGFWRVHGPSPRSGSCSTIIIQCQINARMNN